MGVRTAAGFVALMMAPGAAWAMPIPGDTHLRWLAARDAWTLHAETADATGDGIPDVVVASAERVSWASCLGTGSPMPIANLARNEGREAAAWTVLDGSTGAVVGRQSLERPEDALRITVLEDLDVGDLDGDGTTDVLVLRSEFDLLEETQTQITSMFSLSDRSPRWETVHTIPRRFPQYRSFTPLSLGATGGGLLAESIVEPGVTGFTIRGISHVVGFETPGSPPVTLASLDATFPLVEPTATGYRVVTTSARLTIGPGSVVGTLDLKAYDIAVEPAVTATLRWEREGAGGAPAIIADGDEPLLVLGKGRGDGPGHLAAISLASGEPAWIAPIDVGLEGGSLLASDLDGDGDRDVVAGPRFSEDDTGLLRGGLTPGVVALDGDDGSVRWMRTEPLGKITFHELAAADLDADGIDEIVASGNHQDGFALCAQPADDAGLVAVYDASDGAARCRFATDRLAMNLAGANLDDSPGDEIVAPTVGGNVYAFANAEPGCGLLSRL